MKRIVVKLGGSIITKKREGLPEVRLDVLKRLCEELNLALIESDIQVILVHGAGPFGHAPAKIHRLNEGYFDPKQIEGVVETRASMEKLNSIVVNQLIGQDVSAVSFQPSASGVLRDGRLHHLDLTSVKLMIDKGLVPVGYGDVLMDEERGFKILSGDQLTTYLALKLGAEMAVMVGDFDGVFMGEAGASEKIEVLTRKNIDTIKSNESGAVDVTGGFYGKLLELLDLSDKGVDTHIISGMEEGFLFDTLISGEKHGTLITKK